ncbi:MAG: hypothetical protein ACYTFQ_32070, partial [Planctomycetota bacterium]
ARTRPEMVGGFEFAAGLAGLKTGISKLTCGQWEIAAGAKAAENKGNVISVCSFHPDERTACRTEGI